MGAVFLAVVVVVVEGEAVTAFAGTFGGEVALLLEDLRVKTVLNRSKARPKLFRLAVRSVADRSCCARDDMTAQSLIAKKRRARTAGLTCW